MITYSVYNTIGTIVLSRPEKAHAYNQTMLNQLADAWQALEAQVAVVVIRSIKHPAFCGGADLSEMRNKTEDDAFALHSQHLFDNIARSSIVSIASVHGAAVAGGCELALACDLRVIGPQAYFSLPEVSLGLIPSAGGCTRLTELIGPSRARAVILGGEKIQAEEALRWGLANRLSETPYESAMEWAEQIAKSDPIALRLAKRVLTNPSLARERLCEAILYRNRSDQ